MRHAWLILTHGSFDILEKQLRFLDSADADFYIHVDAKAEFDPKRFEHITKQSAVTFIKRRRISWGHCSIMEAELDLLAAAVPGEYDYYHLLSGVDVPIKTREYIEEYFEKTKPGTNFVHVWERDLCREHLDRVKYYYPLQRFNIQNRILRLGLRRAEVLFERPFVDRTKKDPSDWHFVKGAQWFSITNDLAKYVLEHDTWLRRRYKSTFCPDEMFMASLVESSPFRDTLPSDYCGDDHRNCLRYIDWTRGKPYTFRTGDYDELISAPKDYLFARKFSSADPEIVNLLFEHFGEKQQ